MRIQPRFREDGTVSPSFFEGAGDRSIHLWLRQRLEGNDRYFPINSRVDEDPDRLVLTILQDAGPRHPVGESIVRCLDDLLDEARRAAPQVPAFFGGLLRICQQMRLPLLSSWFTEELERIAGDLPDAEHRWGGWSTVEEILHGAILQAPGLPDAASRESWKRLFQEPRCTTIALHGLGPAFPQRLPFLNEWWKRCPPEERDRELDEMIFTGLKVYEFPELRSLLLLHEDHYDEDLREAVNNALRQYGMLVIFEEGSYSNSLTGVGSPC